MYSQTFKVIWELRDASSEYAAVFTGPPSSYKVIEQEVKITVASPHSNLIMAPMRKAGSRLLFID